MASPKRSTWILLRGLAREKGHWGHFSDQFAQSLPDEDVLAIDLPGTGEFLDHPSPSTISEIFDFVRARAIERSRTQGDFKILALSLGGMVAMEWMRRRPEDLSSCVLINSSARSLSPAYHRLRWQNWANVVRLATVQSAKERERGIIEMIMNNPEARDTALPLWTKIAIDRPISVRNFANQLRAAATFSGLESECKTPTLILNGLGDRFVDPSCSTQFHTVWGWPIVRHPWAGHDLPWDDPKWVIDHIIQWDRHS
jgi:pimeloyl-ACP methyl ester carboxylesterase